MICLKDFIFAYTFAAEKHKGQFRKGNLKIPFVNHPIEVANLLAQALGTNDLVLLTAAVLHDILEDTNTDPSEIKTAFGGEILSVIQEVTDDMSLKKSIRKAKQVENAHRLSERAKLIRIADKICNIQDIVKAKYHWTNVQKIEYINWSIQVVEHCKGINKHLDKSFIDAVDLSSAALRNL
jgi:guanosine-3',5'-bis(diphosphate) 3'-pyrophosphohydrolase